MNIREMIAAVRDDYVEQLRDFITAERLRYSDVFAERRVEAPNSKMFARAYVADVSFGDPVTRMSDLVPRPRAGKLPPVTLNTPGIAITFDELWWHDVRIEHDGSYDGRSISLWFDRWFPRADPARAREHDGAGLIHSVTVDEKWITVDFGSAAIGALFELLTVTQRCGAKTAWVSAGTTEPGVRAASGN
ncbi:MAG: hypothetical protein E7773_13765 [Sphingomonas sp.]|uniref:hypothetical protein n=1 Tax=Sphingomonas sp. TaxID=28214 RepID=UPI001228E3B0|nr:hypothetical protein [Sphingomonas sp.]THD34729.1 MAG: hypothetical protein E7773_13765 [Sphingomonas sp.]